MNGNFEKKLQWIGGLFSSADDLSISCYDSQGNLLATTCPQAELFDCAFEMCESKLNVFNYFKTETAPYIAGLPFGLVWIAAADKTETPPKHIYLLGPMRSGNGSLRQIQLGLEHCEQKYPGQYPIMEIAKSLEGIQVISGNLLQRYALMLHYIINEEKLALNDISTRTNTNDPKRKNWVKTRDRHQNWMAEQALMRMVREGDMNYESVLRRAQSVRTGVHFNPSNSFRRSQDSVIVFTSNCVRAAIDGGLSPDEAYTVGDQYIQDIENCGELSELTAISHTMYEDFIKRVHKKRSNPKLSAVIQHCCDYIELHVEEKLRIRDLAQKFGYTEYYLSKRFKKEVGVTINTYIKYVKVERAKLLLLTTDLDVGEISEILCFSSRSYLGEVFAEVTGFTPAQYRQQHSK